MYRRNTVKPMKPVLKRGIRRFQTLPGKWSVCQVISTRVRIKWRTPPHPIGNGAYCLASFIF